MGRRPKWGRPVDGVLLLNKDGGMTSNDALQKAKRLFFAKRAGHTGSLDPLATGVLPICFGESAKFSQYLLDADKRYSSTFLFGVKTETGDCDGEIVNTCDASMVTRELVESRLDQFRGDIWQVPSMYSALKYQGKPIYQWAREGVEVAREPRQVTIYHYEVTAFRENGQTPEVDVEVHCSKGTYIRSLSEDLGECLGVGAHVIRLHRRAAAGFDEKDSISLQELEQRRGDLESETLDEVLLPIDTPVKHLPETTISQDMGGYFKQGQPVMSTEAYRFSEEGGMVRVFLENGDFLGVAQLVEGQLAPKRLVN